jgi:hypothetical protein
MLSNWPILGSMPKLCRSSYTFMTTLKAWLRKEQAKYKRKSDNAINNSNKTMRQKHGTRKACIKSTSLVSTA